MFFNYHHIAWLFIDVAVALLGLAALHAPRLIPYDDAGADTRGAAPRQWHAARRLLVRIGHDEFVKRRVQWAWLAALTGLYLLQISPTTNQKTTVGPAPTQELKGAGQKPEAGGGSSHDQSSTILPTADSKKLSADALRWSVGISAIGMALGAALLITGAFIRSRILQGVGAASLAWGAFSHSSLIGSVKLGDLLKIEKPEFKIEKPELKFAVAQKTGPIMPSFHHLLTVTGFTPGHSEINKKMQADIQKNVCDRLKDGRATGELGTIMIIGGTDRVALNPVTRKHFESNFGLAEARAEKAKEEIRRCEVPPVNVFTLSAGPHEFPDLLQAPARYAGADEDRRAEFWVLWQPVKEDGVHKKDSAPTKSLLSRNGLTIFGLLSAVAMVACYALEEKGRGYSFGLALGCLATAVYGILQGSSWLFVGLEIVWAGFALWRWRGRRKALMRNPSHRILPEEA